MGIEGVNRVISKIKRWVVDAIAAHKAVSDAHHVKYTDAEALAACEFHDGGEAGGAARSLGNTDAHSLSLKTNGVERIQITGNGLVGMGCTPDRLFTLYHPNDSIMKFRCDNADSVFGISLFYGALFYGGFDCFGPSWHGDANWRNAVLFTAASNNNGKLIFRTKAGGSYHDRMQIDNDGTFDFKDNIIKNPKNHVASALSGTKKLVEIDIGGTPYYFEVYPTKA